MSSWPPIPAGKPGKFSTSVVVVSCPPAAIPLASMPSYMTATECQSVLRDITVAAVATLPEGHGNLRFSSARAR